MFNDARASDPTHSFLSKDHFNLILNEPAGKIAKVIVVCVLRPFIPLGLLTSCQLDERRTRYHQGVGRQLREREPPR